MRNSLLSYRSRHKDENYSFLILFLLFVVAVELNEVDHLNAWEIAFMIYSLGFSLEKVAAMQEHGIRGDSLRVSNHAPPAQGVDSFLHRYLGTWRIYAMFHVFHKVYRTDLI